jgi:FtsP/CotA-like multicopper oxidase with cupredoxin domain
LLHGSDARIYNIGFADERAFDLIATGAGLLEQPHRLRRVQLSPGERAEIVARFEPGETIVLRSFKPDLDTNFFFSDRFAGGDDSFDLLQIRAATTLDRAPHPPDRLAPSEPLAEATAPGTRRLDLSLSEPDQRRGLRHQPDRRGRHRRRCPRCGCTSLREGPPSFTAWIANEYGRWCQAGTVSSSPESCRSASGCTR